LFTSIGKRPHSAPVGLFYFNTMLNITNEDNMNLMARYPNKYFDLAIVDPPYGIGEDGSTNNTRSKLAKSKNYKSFAGEDMLAPNKEYFNELQRVSKNQIIWGANHFIENIPLANSSCWIVWDKKNGENDFADCELAWTNQQTAVRKFDFKWHGMLQGDMKNKEIRIHPTQKPVALYKWLLDKYAKEGDKILDSHLGSGSIAIACHDYGFDLTACELDAEYYTKAMQRINDHCKQIKMF
jgi:site-specific DNA-methyltransferase (adenine-specific)